MSNKISALIFSINEYDLVRPKIKLLYPYVDEIVIIDSSTDKKQKRLMKNLEKKFKKVRVIWLPPLGVADFYYKIGINECKYEWIFQLDADEIPSKKLLKNLKKLINDKYDAYKIYRKYENYKSHEFLFRLIKKDVVHPTGLIHWVMATSSKIYKELDQKRYFIKHYHRTLSNKELTNKRILYETIELFQIGVKILFFFNKKAYVWFEYPKYFNSIKKIVDKILEFGKLGMAFLIVIWSLSYFLFITKKERRFKPLILKYTISFILKVFQKFHYKYLSYLAQDKFGVFEFLGLNNKEEVYLLMKKLEFSNDSFRNFLNLLLYKIKEFYNNFYLRGVGFEPTKALSQRVSYH